MDRGRDLELTALYELIYGDVSEFAATEDLRDDIAFIVTRFH
jgi:hypothetical protein